MQLKEYLIKAKSQAMDLKLRAISGEPWDAPTDLEIEH